MADESRLLGTRLTPCLPVSFLTSSQGSIGHGVATKLMADRGQGLNHAICDIYNLVNAIQKFVQGKAKLEDVIESYAEDSRKRGGDEVRVSRQTAYMLLDWNQVMQTPLLAQGLDREDLRSQVERGPGTPKL